MIGNKFNEIASTRKLSKFRSENKIEYFKNGSMQILKRNLQKY